MGRQEECSVQKSLEWLHFVILCLEVDFCSNHHHKCNDRCPSVPFDQVHRTVAKVKLGASEREFSVVKQENTSRNTSYRHQLLKIKSVES